MPYKHNLRQPYPNELYHFGILGQKWGVRRFQNADGSYTAAGKKRYNSGDGGKPLSARKQKKLDKKMEAAQLESDKKALQTEGENAYTQRKFKEFENSAKSSGWSRDESRLKEYPYLKKETISVSKDFDNNGRKVKVNMEYNPVETTKNGKTMPNMRKTQETVNKLQQNYDKMLDKVSQHMIDFAKTGITRKMYGLSGDEFLNRLGNVQLSVGGNWHTGKIKDGEVVLDMDGPRGSTWTFFYDINKNKIRDIDLDDY